MILFGKKKIDLIIYGFQDSDIVFFFLTGFLGNQTENDQYNFFFFFKFLLYLCFVEGKLVDINYQMTNWLFFKNFDVIS